ncbi:hypothetical protein EVG20_g7501 [Dentipellis fragilis]|uniref:Uncharacterized protein n=1 Tax=Dentipellis fragilis TaxID=205917 RepID=A0A4Y9YDW9_9AGAM|nr:hypothetical protein EVG20_g7501 [Dentipellis fragilis]
MIPYPARTHHIVSLCSYPELHSTRTALLGSAQTTRPNHGQGPSELGKRRQSQAQDRGRGQRAAVLRNNPTHCTSPCVAQRNDPGIILRRAACLQHKSLLSPMHLRFVPNPSLAPTQPSFVLDPSLALPHPSLVLAPSLAPPHTPFMLDPSHALPHAPFVLEPSLAPPHLPSVPDPSFTPPRLPSVSDQSLSPPHAPSVQVLSHVPTNTNAHPDAPQYPEPHGGCGEGTLARASPGKYSDEGAEEGEQSCIAHPETTFGQSRPVEERITTATLPPHPALPPEAFATSTKFDVKSLSPLERLLFGTSPNPMYNTPFSIPFRVPTMQEQHGLHNPGNQIPLQHCNNGYLATEHFPPGMFSMQDSVAPPSSTIDEELSGSAETPTPAPPIPRNPVDEMYPVTTEERFNTGREWKRLFRGLSQLPIIADIHPSPGKTDIETRNANSPYLTVIYPLFLLDLLHPRNGRLTESLTRRALTKKLTSKFVTRKSSTHLRDERVLLLADRLGARGPLGDSLLYSAFNAIDSRHLY